MSLLLYKEAYTVDTDDLYRVTAKVNGEPVKYNLQCLQTKIDSEIETLIQTRLLEKGYSSEELSPIEWE